jgi:hypothetical protein
MRLRQNIKSLAVTLLSPLSPPSLCRLLFCERVPHTPRFLYSANLSSPGRFLSFLVDSRRRQQ